MGTPHQHKARPADGGAGLSPLTGFVFLDVAPN